MANGSTILKLSLLLAMVMATQAYVRVCYYTNWSQYRNGLGKYSLRSHYQKGLCTHLMFSFGKVVKSGNEYTIDQYEWNDKSNLYKEMQDLKKDDPGLKTLLAIGGWTHASNGFSPMVSSKQNRAAFIKNSMKFIQDYGFDGLDLDWEFPGEGGDRGSSPIDRQRFTYLCQEMAAVYHDNGLLVTAAVKAAESSVRHSYEVAKVAQALDFINLMTYDLYGHWSSTLGHHTNTDRNARPHNLHLTVETWLKNGANPKKLVLGLGSYGRAFSLKNKCQYHPGHPGGKARAGRMTGEGGFLAYYEICQMKFDNHVCTKDSKVHAPYGNAGDQWVGYDDQESIVYKIENVMKKHNLLGYMFWALDLDDFTGKFCGQGKYPLMNAAKDAAEGRRKSYSCMTKDSCDGVRPPPPPEPTMPTNPPVVVTGKCKGKAPWGAQYDVWCNQGENCQLACNERNDCKQGRPCSVCICPNDPEPPKTTTTTTTRSTTTTTTTTPKTITTTRKTKTTTTKGSKMNCKPKLELFIKIKWFCNAYCYRCDKNIGSRTTKFFNSYCTCE